MTYFPIIIFFHILLEMAAKDSYKAAVSYLYLGAKISSENNIDLKPLQAQSIYAPSTVFMYYLEQHAIC